MGFTTESAKAAAAAKKNVIQAVDTVESQVARDKAFLARMKRAEVERYYITSPLARAPESVKASAMHLELQVHPGPTAYKDEDGKNIIRPGGTVVLSGGEGVTTNKLWAEYLKQEWPELEISEIPTSGASNYRQEIEDAKADLAEVNS